MFNYSCLLVHPYMWSYLWGTKRAWLVHPPLLNLELTLFKQWEVSPGKTLGVLACSSPLVCGFVFASHYLLPGIKHEIIQ